MRTVIGVIFVVLAFALIFALIAFAKGIDAAIFTFVFVLVVAALLIIGIHFMTW